MICLDSQDHPQTLICAKYIYGYYILITESTEAKNDVLVSSLDVQEGIYSLNGTNG